MMYRQSPVRSQRSKGIKVKHFVQLFVLLAVCFWLLHQVQHSHEKNKEFEESDAIKLGRKDIQTLAEATTLENIKPNESANEEMAEEHGPKLDMVKEKEDDGEGGVDDETDEHGVEKSATEVVNKDEDLVHSKKEMVVEDEDEAQETDSDEVSRHIEEASSVEDGESTNVHEAREEHYKADDASSAVTHDMHEHTEANEDHESAEESDEGESWKDLELGSGEAARDDEQQNIKTGSTEGYALEKAENGSPPNTTATDAENMSSKNVTESVSELNNGTEVLVHQGNNTNAIPETEDVEIESEQSDTSDGTNEALESTNTENPEEIPQDDAIDFSDTSISSEDRDARVDRDTLLEMQSQGENNEAAAEG